MTDTAQVSANRRQLFVASSTTALFIGTNGMLSLFVPLFALELGASPAQIGLLISLGFVLPLFLAMPLGGLVDRRGSRGLITISCAVTALVPLLVWAWPTLTALGILRIVTGVTQLLLVVAAQRHVATLGRGQAAERSFGWFSTFQSGGQLLGPLIGGFLLDFLGAGSSFMVAGVLAAAATVVARFIRRGGDGGDTGRLRPYGSAGEIRSLLGNYGVRMAILLSCGVLFAQGVRQSFLPVYLEQLSYAATTIGLLISLRALVSMLVRPFMPAIVRRLGGRAPAAFGMVLLLAVGLGATAFIESFTPLAIAAMMVGVGSGITQPLSIVTITDYVPRNRLGFALGLRLTGNRLAQALSPLLIGLVAEFAGIPWAFIAAAAALLVTAGIILKWRRPFEAQETEAERERLARSDA